MKSGKTIVTILTSAATAAIAGILFAPQKGSITRKKLSKQSRKIADTASDTFKTSLDNITKQFKTIQREAEEGVEKGKEIKKEAVKKADEITDK